jgi:hypothetical protein
MQAEIQTDNERSLAVIREELNKPQPEAETKQPLPRLGFSLDESAQIIGVSYITAYRLNKRGLLKSVGGLRHKIIPLSEIQRFLKVV